MSKILTMFADIGDMEKFVGGSSFIHRLDPRCKIILTLTFIISVVSFPPYTIVSLLPFFAFPLFILTTAGIPLRYLFKKLAVMMIFIICVAAANPWLDRSTAVRIGSYGISGGWLSFASIMLRFFLTAGTAVLLFATTGIYSLCRGLERLAVPQAFTVQLFFLYRYLFTITDDAARLEQARNSRSFGSNGQGVGAFVKIISALLLRSFARAERVYTAMRSRGFETTVAALQPLTWRRQETLFTVVWLVIFLLLRFLFHLDGSGNFY